MSASVQPASQPRVAPYGTWKSPITTELIVGQTVNFGQLAVEVDATGAAEIYWLEQRPSEAGRNAIVRWQHGVAEDLLPAPWNARSRVHEYGGGALLVDHGSVYFANASDQQIYALSPGSMPIPLTATPNCRYANGCSDPRHPRQVWVQEEHLPGTASVDAQTVINRLVTVSTSKEQPDTPSELVSGADFYASPCFSADGSYLAWLSWNQPAMPWESTQLWIAPVHGDGTLGKAQTIAGGERESIFQPRWASDGSLIFVSDCSNWWNLYRWQPETGEVTPLLPMAAEFGLPQWVFAQSTYGLVGKRLIFAYNRENLWSLGHLDLTTGEFGEIPTLYTDITGLQAWVDGGAGGVVFLGGSATQPTAVVCLEVKETAGEVQIGELRVLRQSSQLSLPVEYFSQPQSICFPTEPGQVAYAFYYPPQNPDYAAPAGELPPVLVRSHGGPTAASSSALNLTIQYWTSRGFALLDVNYSGSTGYGRDYRQRLQGQWGILDVSDCIQAAQYAVAQGWADPERLIIRGSSAGGYTTLAALTFAQVFKAGASYYGISDLEALLEDTHKFEARYFDGLVGPYPEALEIYRQRSPIHFVENLSCPVIFFQGQEDKVVPPNQAERMVSALIAKGLPTAYVVFANEQHGFRRSENIKRTLESELYFYAQVFGFPLAEECLPVEIHNLSARTKHS